MKIIVFNGSPKGTTSVTLQYIHYVQKKFPEHELKVLNISQRLRTLETTETAFTTLLQDIETADGIIWSSPVYYLLIPSNFKRFIELIWEKNCQDVFRDKYCAVVTTSIHFFDHIAHNYMHGICDDLNMRYLGGYSADMQDLLHSRERKRLRLFSRHFFEGIRAGIPTSKSYHPLHSPPLRYSGAAVTTPIAPGNRRLLIISDEQPHQSNLTAMIDHFSASFTTEIRRVNLHDLHFKGSCIGCLRCGYDHRCIYEGEDDFIDFYREEVKKADILVWGGSITDRYLSARWKMFFDRSFFHGHTASLEGKQIAFLLSGPFSQLPNLRQGLQAYVESQRANLAGFITDEHDNSATLDGLLQEMAQRLVTLAESGYISPPSFLGVGGGKIFRDDIWGRFRFPFRADHQAFLRQGIYDFPQLNYISRARNSLMLLLSRSAAFRKEVNKRMTKEMIKPFEKYTK